MIYTARYTERQKNTAGAVYPTWGLETIKPTETVACNSSVTIGSPNAWHASFKHSDGGHL